MEELKMLVDMVAHLPNMALWVLAGYLVFRLVTIGSIYGVAKLAINKFADYLKAKEDAKVRAKEAPLDAGVVVDGIVISGGKHALVAQLSRLTGYGQKMEHDSQYIHDQGTMVLRRALDAEFERMGIRK